MFTDQANRSQSGGNRAAQPTNLDLAGKFQEFFTFRLDLEGLSDGFTCVGIIAVGNIRDRKLMEGGHIFRIDFERLLAIIDTLIPMILQEMEVGCDCHSSGPGRRLVL